MSGGCSRRWSNGGGAGGGRDDSQQGGRSFQTPPRQRGRPASASGVYGVMDSPLNTPRTPLAPWSPQGGTPKIPLAASSPQGGANGTPRGRMRCCPGLRLPTPQDVRDGTFLISDGGRRAGSRVCTQSAGSSRQRRPQKDGTFVVDGPGYYPAAAGQQGIADGTFMAGAAQGYAARADGTYVIDGSGYGAGADRTYVMDGPGYGVGADRTYLLDGFGYGAGADRSYAMDGAAPGYGAGAADATYVIDGYGAGANRTYMVDGPGPGYGAAAANRTYTLDGSAPGFNATYVVDRSQPGSYEAAANRTYVLDRSGPEPYNVAADRTYVVNEPVFGPDNAAADRTYVVDEPVLGPHIPGAASPGQDSGYGTADDSFVEAMQSDADDSFVEPIQPPAYIPCRALAANRSYAADGEQVQAPDRPNDGREVDERSPGGTPQRADRTHNADDRSYAAQRTPQRARQMQEVATPPGMPGFIPDQHSTPASGGNEGEADQDSEISSSESVEEAESDDLDLADIIEQDMALLRGQMDLSMFNDSNATNAADGSPSVRSGNDARAFVNINRSFPGGGRQRGQHLDAQRRANRRINRRQGRS